MPASHRQDDAKPCPWLHAGACGIRRLASSTGGGAAKGRTPQEVGPPGQGRRAIVSGLRATRYVPAAVIYFEDLKIGERSLIGTYVVSKEEAVEFARKWEPQPYHVDEAAAEASLYGGLTVCSLHLFAVCTRLFFQREDQIAVMAMLGKDEVRLQKPARPGEALTYYSECVAKRPSRTRPDSGVVTLVDTLCNPASEAVLTQKVTLLVSRRGSGD
jgi:acyl dehydratase